jgi:hypothetical protein
MEGLRFILVILVATSGFASLSCLSTPAESLEIEVAPTPQHASNSNANANIYALDDLKPPETKTVTMPANVMWFDTGVALKEGQKFVITAEGRWWLGDSSCGPLGTDRTTGDALLPNVDLGTLVARVDDESFIVGDKMSMLSPRTGNLYLSMNAVPAHFKDNKGAIRVHISYGTAPN